MSKAPSYPGDWSTTGSNAGMSQHDSTCGRDFPEPAEYTPPAVANREEKAVTRAKCFFFFFLLLAVCGTATATYLFMENQEQNNFKAAFAAIGSEVSTVAGQRVDQLYSALNAYSVFISSEARADSSSSWPFVTIPDYSLKSESIAELFGLQSPEIIMCPIVNEEDREGWPSFVLEQAPVWYQESIDNEGNNRTVEELMNMTTPYLNYYKFDENNMVTVEKVTRPGPVLANWQTYPLDDSINALLTLRSLDMLTFPEVADQFLITNMTLRPSIGFIQIYGTGVGGELGDLIVDSQIVQPIMEYGKLVGVILLKLPWLEFFENLHIDGLSDTIAVLRSNCNFGIGSSPTEKNELSYLIDSSSAIFLGQLNAHSPKYDDLVVSRVVVDDDAATAKLPDGVCVPKLTLDLYPTEEFEASFQTSKPKLYTVVVVAIFAFTSFVFLLYDYLVGRRQRKFMFRIKRQDQIVSNVFPAAIRDRLYEGDQKGTKDDGLFDPLCSGVGARGAPLADLFLETTIVFADIAGFTAWSSAREPAQVFILLETIYGEFDKLAYLHNVFKVETVGDCYVAVAGLPEPDKDHAMAVCRFARDCVKAMKDTTLKLEVALGPDTSELELRVGIHSGQVTAGVLRGERSRFQLFGDTMNTASRMESTSARSQIQVSQVTADLLVASGFSTWIVPRENNIFVKGKGEMQTYWLKTNTAKGPSKSKIDILTLDETVESSDGSDRTSIVHADYDNFDLDDVRVMTKTERLVEWNVEVLNPLLQQIIASRGGDVVARNQFLLKKEATIGTGKTVLEEFVPIIPLKRFDATELSKRQKASSIDIGEEAKNQLRYYLSNVASMYRDNPFHNFEHASHVTASVKKLLTRIVDVDDGNGLRKPSDEIDLIDMAGHSYGITSDPLTQFSVVFSAIIHDMDHPGVPNAQLVKENTRSAQIFEKSVAEQNSVELAWSMLMGQEYEALRACIYHTEDDLRRFRQLVVNTVMATDIVDKELQALRKARWETAFAETPIQDDNLSSEDCKATIVIEHLIQASDVSHTMQHWHIYKSWNEKFFMECYTAYKAGRADSDPSKNWYKGEIGFFDFYVIPLAKKLDDCGVFGVSSHEYLSYAQSNRDEWAREGEGIVKEYLVKYGDTIRQR
eukprot:scaffold4363_cov125-Cylindrotheca_fusiformis.AAC.5